MHVPARRIVVIALLSAASTGCATTNVRVQASPTVTPTLASVGSSASRESEQLTAARQVQSCMSAHGMATAHVKLESTSGAVFEYCDWPPGPGSDPTGFAVIQVSTRAGPGQSEASDASDADYIDSTCHRLRLSYDFGSQGAYQPLPAFDVAPGTVTSEDHPGQAWDGTSVYPYPTQGEVVYLHNDNQTIDSAICVS